MPGINELYVSHATNIITLHEQQDTTYKISRQRIERQLLRAIDHATLPTDWKISWYSAILTTPLFDSFWHSVCIRHHLTREAAARYIPDSSFEEYTAPADRNNSINGYSPSPTPPPSKARASHLSNRAASEEAEEQEEEEEAHPTNGYHTTESQQQDHDAYETATPASIALAAQLGCVAPSPSPSPVPGICDRNRSSRETLDKNGLARQEGDDGAYGSALPAKKKDSRKAKVAVNGNGNGRGAGKTGAGVKKVASAVKGKGGRAKKGKMSVKFADADANGGWDGVDGGRGSGNEAVR